LLHPEILQVMVFSWSGCPFCKNAKALLADVGADFTALELDTIGQEGKQIRAELAAVSAAATAA
jgi:glutaredoxin